MRILARWTLVAAAVVAAPAVAVAQPASPLMYCAPGSSFSCFGMEFTMSGTTGTFWLQNLQGSVDDDPTPFNISTLEVFRSNPTVEGTPTEQLVWSFEVADGETVGNVDLEPGGGAKWGEDSYAETGFDVFQSRLYFGGGPSSGLFGCDLPPGEWIPESYIGQTCPATGFDGWWRMTFFASIVVAGEFTPLRDLTPDDVAFGIAGCLIRGSASGIGAGARGPDCEVSAYPFDTTVVPEPGTLALVGGGLGFLGLAAWRRRRA